MSNLHDILKIEDVMRELRLSRNTIEKLYRERGLKYAKFGKDIYIIRRWLIDFLEDHSMRNATKEEIGSRVEAMIQKAKKKGGG